MHQQATPLLVSLGSVWTAEPLSRVDLRATESDQYDELWVQELVHKCPSVLPITSIEPAFWPAASICTELPLRSGYLDNLLVTPSGGLIAVECKLWRNMEARRQVIAQIIDYAKDLQTLNFDDLQQAIRSARKEPTYELFKHASTAANEPEPPFDEPRFTDAVNRNLRRGRCLLLIVGDGISENVEAMSEFLQQHAGLHFALALVQLAVHDLPGKMGRVVVPSVPMRTTNIVRGIVQISDGLPTIIPPPEKADVARASTLTEEEFFASLDQLRHQTSDRLVAFLDECQDLQITWEVRKTLIVRMIVGNLRISPFVIYIDGNVDTGYTPGQKELLRRFMTALAAAIPGTEVKETQKTCLVKKRVGGFFTVWELLENSAGVRAALEQLNIDLRRSADAES